MNLKSENFYLKDTDAPLMQAFIISKILDKLYKYSNYTSYRMNSTIQISKQTKELISTFGTRDETYEDIIKRMYRLAIKEQLRDFLYSAENAVTVKEARKMIDNAYS